mmetsp:Transcript_36530/g.77734  ORF Transcript_36530/g.77734 Transcript_36530/m.77734 type:complete len:249 (+) Transcript_36530:598-1344(+)
MAGLAPAAGTASQALHDILQLAFIQVGFRSHSPAVDQGTQEGFSSLQSEAAAIMGAGVGGGVGGGVVVPRPQDMQQDVFMKAGFRSHSPAFAQPEQDGFWSSVQEASPEPITGPSPLRMGPALPTPSGASKLQVGDDQDSAPPHQPSFASWAFCTWTFWPRNWMAFNAQASASSLHSSSCARRASVSKDPSALQVLTTAAAKIPTTSCRTMAGLCCLLFVVESTDGGRKAEWAGYRGWSCNESLGASL